MARRFDSGLNEYLARTSAVITAPPITYACWVKFASLPSSGNYMALIAVTDISTADAFSMSLGNSGGTYYIITNEYDGTGNHYATLVFSPDTTNWFHIAGVFNSTTRECYVNGSGPGTDAGQGAAVAVGLDRTTIGVQLSVGGPYNYLDADIAEVVIYDAALSASEIASQAAGYSPLFIGPQGLIAYWSLIRDEDQDRVGGYDLTAFNTPTIGPHVPIRYPVHPMPGALTSAAPAAFNQILTTYGGYSVPVPT